MISKLALFTAAAIFAGIPAGAQDAASTPPATPPAPQSSAGQPAQPIPPPPLTLEQRGDLAMARKEYRQAVDYYTQALDKKSAIITNKIGIAYHQMMDFGKAKKQYERAIKINPSYSEAMNNLGTVYYAQKNYKKAISQYEKALKVNPNSSSILSNLGTAYFARKKYDEAFQVYAQALAIDPDVFERRNQGGGSMLQERSVEERAKYYFYLSKTYASAGIADRALQYMRKALEEGFKDRKHFVEDPEFAAMQEMPEFQELLAYQPKIL